MTPFSIDLKRSEGNIVFVATTTITRASISLFPLLKRELNVVFLLFFFLVSFFFQKPWLGFANWRKRFQKWKVISLPIDSSVTIAYYHFSFFAVFKYEFYLFKTTVLLKPFFFCDIISKFVF